MKVAILGAGGMGETVIEHLKKIADEGDFVELPP